MNYPKNKGSFSFNGFKNHLKHFKLIKTVEWLKKNENINGWVIDNNIKITHKLNFELLNNCNFYKKIK